MHCMNAGYSGTPLVRKLGLKPGMRVCALHAPRDYREIVAPWPDGVELVDVANAAVDLVHLFAQHRALLQREAERLRRLLGPDAVLWVSWPKRASKIASEIGENDIREVALPLGWVDVKVCAVDATWSGLKLVIRRANRK